MSAGFERALWDLVEGTSQTGQAFFEALVRHLASALQMRHAFLAVRDPEAPDERAQVLAYSVGGRLVSNFSYELQGSPCEELFEGAELRHISSGVTQAYSEDEALVELGVESYLGVPLRDVRGEVLGVLVVLDREPIEEASQHEAILRIFASRAASELERLRAERMNEQSQQRLHLALEAARVGTWSLRIAQERMELDAQAAELLGELPEPLELSLGAFLEALGPAHQGGELEGVLWACARGEELDFQTTHELTMQAPGARTCWLEVCGRVTSWEQGSPARMNGTLHDITRRTELEHKLAHGQKLEALGQLAGGIAHDFNNLLTVVLSYVDLLGEQLAARGELLAMLEPVRQAAERGAELTRQLLAFSRSQVSTPRLIDPNAAVRRVARMIERLVGEDVVLGLELSEEVGSLLLDPNQLELVLINLAVNARDAMPQGGALTLATYPIEPPRSEEVAPGQSWMAVAVGDEGVGMSQEIQRQVFEPFFTTKRSGQGTGMGLATCRSIVAQSGGFIRLESAPGQGATFELCWPSLEEPPAEIAPRRSSTELPGGDETILLAEDDDQVRRVAADTLGALGYVILTARDGREALEVAATHEGAIDLLLSDVLMPRLHGGELARQLLALRPEVDVLFTSGYVGDERLRELLAELRHPVLMKPYTSRELARRVRRVLGEHQES